MWWDYSDSMKQHISRNHTAILDLYRLWIGNYQYCIPTWYQKKAVAVISRHYSPAYPAVYVW